MDDRPTWLVECRDIASRPCVVTVLVDGDRVVIVGPPGETAVFSSSEVETLRNALRAAASAATRHDTALAAGRQR
ncbi:hypothetical protein [Actinoalloteichus spitiensis]|uniref:hypothetical protein n=1 Tax=Actinoalloteichus spitiensis TaxID=252394 RepID=UPI0002D71D27|nr:hypothetical protein [Actinoalloteichus spitiensis]